MQGPLNILNLIFKQIPRNKYLIGHPTKYNGKLNSLPLQ